MKVRSWSVIPNQATESRTRDLLTAALSRPTSQLRFREILSVNPKASQEWNNYFHQKRRAILFQQVGILPRAEAAAKADPSQNNPLRKFLADDWLVVTHH